MHDRFALCAGARVCMGSQANRLHPNHHRKHFLMDTLSSLVAYRHPPAQPRSAFFQVWVNGEMIDALHAEKADFAVFECSGSVDVLVIATSEASGTAIRPLSTGITPLVDNRSVRFQIDGPRHLCLDIPDLKPLFIYANAPEVDRPSPNAPGMHFYAAGRIHEAGEITLRDGETLYIEAGAVVRGSVRCSHSDRVSILGRGILDGGYYDYDTGDRVRSIVFDHCTRIRVNDIVMIEPTSWMLVFGCCRDVRVDGLKQIGSCMSSDGIDVCASRDVVIENCCLRNDDDNIAIKAGSFEKITHWHGDVDNVLVRKCVFLNGRPGNVMEIGYELRADRVSNITFEDIDVIYAHGEGAVFSIHNGDRAVVENVLWDNIRVEHYWDKLVDFRVVHSRYNRDPERGSIRNVRLRNIHVAHSFFNPGCSISLISGYSRGSPVRQIVFEDFFLNEKKVYTPDEIELHTRNVEEIRFL